MIADSIYKSVVGLRNYFFDHEILRSRRLQWPVISVGNISVGGSGKTPFVIALGQLLSERGIQVDVLSRGYRRSTSGVLRVEADGSPDQFGDEPLLIARKLGSPVIVGEDRFLAGLEAEERSNANRMHLLDDGFQHRQLHRDFDIVLVNDEDLEDKLLPSGRLREPLTALRRADAVVIDKNFSGRLPTGDFQVWRSERKLEIPGMRAELTTVPARPRLSAIAFCGIARPQRFFAELRKAGVDVCEEIAFRDHHRYSEVDLEKLRAAQIRNPGARLVTTEKDAINLGSHRERLDALIVPMNVELLDAETAISSMLHRIARRRESSGSPA
jgi:tetraacyldisaccharide 4'-kinase